MTRIFESIQGMAGFIMIGGTIIMMTSSGCAYWKKSPEPPLLGSRGTLPAPYLQPGEEAPEETGFEEDSDTMDFSTTPIIDEPYDGVDGDSGTLDMPPSVESPTLEYTVRKGDSLWKIAQKYGVSYKELAAYNDMDPDDTLVVGKSLTIPPGGTARDNDAELGVSDAPDHAGYTPNTIERESIPSDRKYTVKSGDNLWVIARKFGIKVADLRNLNDLSSDTIHVGDVLVLPASAEAESESTSETTDDEEETTPATDNGVPDVETTIYSEDESPNGVEEQGNLLDHTVMEGDTLEEIADMYGTSVKAIKRVNPELDNDDDLVVNKSIKIPFE